MLCYNSRCVELMENCHFSDVVHAAFMPSVISALIIHVQNTH